MSFKPLTQTANWNPPSDWLRITTIDAHTEGEPFRVVTSGFPDLPGRPRPVSCAEWGGGDMRAHHLWWLGHLPHVAGETDGVRNNWWEYVVDPNRVD